MKICDLECLESVSETGSLSTPNIIGGIEIEVGSIVLSMGSTFALTFARSWTWSYAPGLNLVRNLGTN